LKNQVFESLNVVILLFYVLASLFKDAPARVAAEETELCRPSHRSMLRLLTVEAAEHREAHCAAASSLCLSQLATAVELIDACR